MGGLKHKGRYAYKHPEITQQKGRGRHKIGTNVKKTMTLLLFRDNNTVGQRKCPAESKIKGPSITSSLFDHNDYFVGI